MAEAVEEEVMVEAAEEEAAMVAVEAAAAEVAATDVESASLTSLRKRSPRCVIFKCQFYRKYINSS